MKKIALACVLAISCLYAAAQEKTIKPLTLGETIPPAIISHIYSLKKNPASQGLPVILEFFATYCSTCMQSLPKLHALQKAYSDRLLILPVTSEPQEKVTHLLYRHPELQPGVLTFTSGDTLLNQYLPYRSVPHLVWISGQGKIEAITTANEATAQNIDQLLSGTSLKLPFKDNAFEYSPALPLASQMPDSAALLFQTTIGGPLPNAKSNLYGTITLSKGLSRKYFTNMTLVHILQIALGKLNLNRFLILSKDSVKLTNARNTASALKPELYCYETILPQGYREADYLQQLLSDLGRASGLNISYATQTVDCYVLKKLPAASDLLQQKKEQPQFRLPRPEQPKLVMIGQPIRRLVDALNGGNFENRPPVVIDETGITTPVSLTLNTPGIRDFSAIATGLERHGLTLQKARRAIKMVVIKDATNTDSITSSKAPAL